MSSSINSAVQICLEKVSQSSSLTWIITEILTTTYFTDTPRDYMLLNTPPTAMILTRNKKWTLTLHPPGYIMTHMLHSATSFCATSALNLYKNLHCMTFLFSVLLVESWHVSGEFWELIWTARLAQRTINRQTDRQTVATAGDRTHRKTRHLLWAITYKPVSWSKAKSQLDALCHKLLEHC